MDISDLKMDKRVKSKIELLNMFNMPNYKDNGDGTCTLDMSAEGQNQLPLGGAAEMKIGPYVYRMEIISTEPLNDYSKPNDAVRAFFQRIDKELQELNATLR